MRSISYHDVDEALCIRTEEDGGEDEADVSGGSLFQIIGSDVAERHESPPEHEEQREHGSCKNSTGEIFVEAARLRNVSLALV